MPTTPGWKPMPHPNASVPMQARIQDKITQAAGTTNTTIATTAFAATEAANQAVAMAIALG